MNKVKVILDVFSDNSLTDHLKQLDGIFNVEVNYGKEELKIIKSKYTKELEEEIKKAFE